MSELVSTQSELSLPVSSYFDAVWTVFTCLNLSRHSLTWLDKVTFLWFIIVWIYQDRQYSEWVSDCCLTPIQKFSSYIMARISSFSMIWWWGPLCTRPTRLVWLFYSASSLKQQSAYRHVTPLGYIILIPSQPVFALSP